MLLDDTQQRIYFGRGQVMTYDEIDEHRIRGFRCSLYKNFTRQLKSYDSIVEDTGIKLFKLRRMTDV